MKSDNEQVYDSHRFFFVRIQHDFQISQAVVEQFLTDALHIRNTELIQLIMSDTELKKKAYYCCDYSIPKEYNGVLNAFRGFFYRRNLELLLLNCLSFPLVLYTNAKYFIPVNVIGSAVLLALLPIIGYLESQYNYKSYSQELKTVRPKSTRNVDTCPSSTNLTTDTSSDRVYYGGL